MENEEYGSGLLIVLAAVIIVGFFIYSERVNFKRCIEYKDELKPTYCEKYLDKKGDCRE